ncbi:MAG: response regulator [Alphaproteobacteria bacterium]|nr:response regulator [Alphaproteobacteria bacterium]
MRVLIVDDNENMRRMAASLIVAIGAEVECAANVDEALTAFNAADHDLIITDIEMGEKSGFDLIREIRAVSPETIVIALTSRTDLSRLAFFEAGFDWALWKPLDAEALVIALRAVDVLGHEPN